eukprot:1154868-Pelagomonas_calceolata.AAC.11
MACDHVNLCQFVVDLRSRHLSYWNQSTAPDPWLSEMHMQFTLLIQCLNTCTWIFEAFVGRRGFGVTVIAANSCFDYMSLYEDSENLQCIWIRCNKVLFGFEDDVMLRAAYVNPQSAQFLRDDVTNSFSTLFDEFLCAAQ